MSLSGANQPLQPHASAPTSLSSASSQRDAAQAWAKRARKEIEERLDAIRRAAGALALSTNDTQRVNVRHVQTAESEARAALDALDALLAFQSAPLTLAPLEVSDLLMAALARWKTRAPNHTFELALPGQEPTIVGDANRIERALDAVIALMVAGASGGDVRVALRYVAAPGNDEPKNDEAVISVRAADPAGRQYRFEAEEPGLNRSSAHEEAIALTLARAVAEAHGGQVWSAHGPERDALTLGITLPAMPIAPASAQLRAGERESEQDEALGAAAGPSLPIARQLQVALVAHSDSRMARYLRVNLERAGFRALTAGESASALRVIDAEEPDIVLLDAALDAALDGAGSDPLRRALARTTAPIILLIRDANPAHAANALDLGAADVIAMPLSMEETLARVRRALRSTAASQRHTTGSVTVCGDLEIDESERRVTVAGEPVMLSKTEYRLLRALARSAGKTVAHEALLEQVWGPAYSQEIEFIWVYIRRLRRKIERDPARPRYIQTAPGVGYYLAAPAPASTGV
ncbi:MAG TPA: winged helix-turn-helix domain-containing protein [Ktedonobacterales bacterium]